MEHVSWEGKLLNSGHKNIRLARHSSQHKHPTYLLTWGRSVRPWAGTVQAICAQCCPSNEMSEVAVVNTCGPRSFPCTARRHMKDLQQTKMHKTQKIAQIYFLIATYRNTEMREDAQQVHVGSGVSKKSLSTYKKVCHTLGHQHRNAFSCSPVSKSNFLLYAYRQNISVRTIYLCTRST